MTPPTDVRRMTLLSRPIARSAEHRCGEALKRSASALKADGVPFALAGSYALWVHGAPESTHDVDLVVPERARRGGGAQPGRRRVPDRAAARGLVVQGVPRRGDGRRAAPAERRSGRCGPARARRGHRGAGPAHSGAAADRGGVDQAAGAHRAVLRLRRAAAAGARGPGAARLAAAARANPSTTPSRRRFSCSPTGWASARATRTGRAATRASWRHSGPVSSGVAVAPAP